MPARTENLKYPGIIVGKAGERQMLEGWHERERDGRFGIPYRASTASGSIVLKRIPGSQNLNMILSGPVPLHGGKMDGRIIVNRRKYELPLAVDIWVFRSYPIESSRDMLEITFQIDNPVVPGNVIGNGDSRQLGWFLSAVWQE